MTGNLLSENGSVSFESGVEVVPLLELYTSEGCSSCPPAEKWMGSLKNRHGLWKTFVPVAFHVDYWNRLGWKDRFSDPAHAERQRDYAALFGTSTIFTPQFIFAGRNWSPSEDAFPQVSRTVGVLKVDLAGDQAVVSFEPTTDMEGGLVLEAAVLGSELITNVQAGENAGRKLNHDFVVLKSTQSPFPQTEGRRQVTMALPRSEEASAAAFWVRRAESPAPLQSTGGWLGKD